MGGLILTIEGANKDSADQAEVVRLRDSALEALQLQSKGILDSSHNLQLKTSEINKSTDSLVRKLRQQNNDIKSLSVVIDSNVVANKHISILNNKTANSIGVTADTIFQLSKFVSDYNRGGNSFPSFAYYNVFMANWEKRIHLIMKVKGDKFPLNNIYFKAFQENKFYEKSYKTLFPPVDPGYPLSGTSLTDRFNSQLMEVKNVFQEASINYLDTGDARTYVLKCTFPQPIMADTSNFKGVNFFIKSDKKSWIVLLRFYFDGRAACQAQGIWQVKGNELILVDTIIDSKYPRRYGHVRWYWDWSSNFTPVGRSF